MARRKSTDEWAAIEAEYCRSDDSIREIADRHSIAEAAIRKRAKAEKWQRPDRKVRTTARCALPSEAAPPPPALNPEAPIDAARIADGGRGLIGRMLDELDVVTSRRGELEDMIEAATDGDDEDDRRIAMDRAVSLPSRANTMKTLALALKTLNEASAPQGKKAAAQERANELAGGSRFRPVGKPSLSVVKQ